MKAIIIDVGGVLRDSSLCLNEAYKTALKEVAGLEAHLDAQQTWRLRGLAAFNGSQKAMAALYAVQVSGQNLGDILGGPAPEQRLAALVRQHPLSADQLARLKQIYDREFYTNEQNAALIKLISGVPEALRLLKQAGLKIGVVSNSRRDFSQRWFDSIGIARYLDAVLGEEDVQQKKPAPEGILKACAALGVRPADAAYVGDAGSDVQAAHNAGCMAVAVLSGMGTAEALKKENPGHIFKDLREFAGWVQQSSLVV